MVVEEIIESNIIVESKYQIRSRKVGIMVLKIKNCIEIVLAMFLIIMFLTYHYLDVITNVAPSIRWFGITYYGNEQKILVDFVFLLGMVCQFCLISSFLISKDFISKNTFSKLTISFLVIWLLIPIKLITVIEEGVFFNFFGVIFVGYHKTIIVDSLLYIGLFLQVVLIILIKIDGEKIAKK